MYRSRRLLQHCLRLGACISLISLSATFGRRSASAWVAGGCRWSGIGTRNVYYWPQAGSGWNNRFVEAANRWNDGAFDVLYVAASSPSTADLFIYEVPGAPNTSTQIVNYCNGGLNGAGTYISFNVWANGAGYNGASSMITASHELGHASGLGHTLAFSNCTDSAGYGGTQPKSVMRTGDQWWAYNNCGGVLPPYADDIAGVNYLMPGGK
jgi:hypothetical protein